MPNNCLKFSEIIKQFFKIFKQTLKQTLKQAHKQALRFLYVFFLFFVNEAREHFSTRLSGDGVSPQRGELI